MRSKESYSQKVKLPRVNVKDKKCGWARDGEWGYYRGVIDKKKMMKKKKKDIITIDSNSISIFFYQLYFSNYICTLTRKLIDQAMFRACGRTRTRRR